MYSYILFCAIFVTAFINIQSRTLLDNYYDYRENLLLEDGERFLGGHIKLTPDEIEANDILMHWKYKEINDSLSDPDYYAFSKPFVQYRDRVENSVVYQIIRSMPKGAALHIHNSLALGAEFLLSLTYEDNLYLCSSGKEFRFQFSTTTPQSPCSAKWALVSDIRKSSKDVTQFDNDIKRRFSLFAEDDEIIPDVNTIWNRFNEVYYALKTLIKYRPVREKFFTESLRQLHEDNVMYAEIRTGLGSVYELNGTYHEKIYMARLYQQLTNNFIAKNPGFFGIKLIMTQNRNTTEEAIYKNLNLARVVKKEIPELLAGFDLVGQEDLGKPLIDFARTLILNRYDMNYFFHAGETNWFGTSTDENLYDAVLLGTRRLGHAYSLIKHPSLMAAVKKRGIAIETNVISNVMLSLVHDVRNHPLATYLAYDLPIVLSSDDPGAWGTTPLSDDFYVAFMGCASTHSDLRLLKQLAMNSIKYSIMNVKEHILATAMFQDKWDVFIKNVVEKYRPSSKKVSVQ